MKLYANNDMTKDTRDMLKELEGKDIWVRCWIAELTRGDYGDISGYVYIKVRDVWEEHCDVYVIPIADLTDSSWEEVWSWEDIAYLMTSVNSVYIPDMDFDVMDFERDRYTTEDMIEIFSE